MLVPGAASDSLGVDSEAFGCYRCWWYKLASGLVICLLKSAIQAREWQLFLSIPVLGL